MILLAFSFNWWNAAKVKIIFSWDATHCGKRQVKNIKRTNRKKAMWNELAWN